MSRLSLEDRIARDGDRWRYIKGLETELDRQRTRHQFLRFSVALNAALIIFLIWQVSRP